MRVALFRMIYEQGEKIDYRTSDGLVQKGLQQLESMKNFSMTLVGPFTILVSFFVWSLTVGGLNHVNTPYKTTQKTSLRFSVQKILASKLELDSSTCSKTQVCLHLSQGALKRSGGGIQNQSVCSPGGLIEFFHNQF